MHSDGSTYALAYIITNGIAGTKMGAYGSTLKEDEILKLIAYIRSVTKNELKMDAKTLFDMHRLMLGNEVIMTYSGYMSQALLTSIASVLKQQIEQDHLPRKVMRNIFCFYRAV